MEQIEDLGDLLALGQVVPAGLPQRLLPVHEQDELLFAIVIVFSRLLGHPLEDRIHLRCRGVLLVALQGRPHVLEAGLGACGWWGIAGRFCKQCLPTSHPKMPLQTGRALLPITINQWVRCAEGGLHPRAIRHQASEPNGETSRQKPVVIMGIRINVARMSLHPTRVLYFAQQLLLFAYASDILQPWFLMVVKAYGRYATVKHFAGLVGVRGEHGRNPLMSGVKQWYSLTEIA
jgi:hypothetical protein